MLAYLIIDKEDEDELSKNIIDYIATNIDDIISRYDIRVLDRNEITENIIHSIPCLHVEDENYYTKRDIMCMLKSGCVIKDTNLIEATIRELSGGNISLSEQIREEDNNERIDSERQSRMTKMRADREKLGGPKMPSKKTAAMDDVIEDSELIELDNSTLMSRIMDD